MKAIRGEAKNLRTLLGGTKFSIDYYQREYRWESKQIDELIKDLAERGQGSVSGLPDGKALEGRPFHHRIA